MRLPRLHRGLLFCLALLGAVTVPVVHAGALYIFTLGALRDSSANVLPDGALLVLVAYPGTGTPPVPIGGTALTRGAAFPGGGVVQSTWAVDSKTTGFSGGSVRRIAVGAGVPNLSAGQNLALYWFPSATVANPTPAAGSAYGTYRTSAIAPHSTIGWVTVDATSTANHEIGFITTDVGGDVPTSAAVALLVVATPVAPVLTVQPQSQIATTAGGTATFSVTASGEPAPTYQWYFNSNAIAGATSASLTLTNVQPASVGRYYVIVSNSKGSVTSSSVTLVIEQPGNAATHAIVGSNYFAGQNLTITNTLSYTGRATALSWSVLLPAGWTFVSANGNALNAIGPVAGQGSELDWTWPSIPPSPLTFSYTVAVPTGQTGAQQIVALVGVNNGVAQQFLATPDPLTVSPVTTHSADTDLDNRISLPELTRVIALYNTRNGTTRTGCYAVATTTTEDGFAPEPTRPNAATVTLTRYHSADTDRNGKLSLVELTRVIELYNTRSGTLRTGAYHAEAGTEDGYASGP